MPKYKVVFANGEKRNLTVKAEIISEAKPSLLKFKTADGDLVAIVPLEKILYVVEIKEDE